MKADGHTGKDIAKYPGVSRATLYRYLASERAQLRRLTRRASTAYGLVGKTVGIDLGGASECISQLCGADQVDCGRSGETDVIQRLGGIVLERVGQRALLPARGTGCVPTAGASAGTGTTSDPLPRRAAMAAMATYSWSGSDG
jgi:hydroxyethylthiazole kinase-like sugar kinase family protein